MADCDEKLAESVRKYTCLYDKESPEFKNKEAKELCWKTVAQEIGVKDEEAKRLFTNLRNKHAREKKKVESKKVSGTSTEEVIKAKKETSEMHIYLSWLDPYVQHRKTTSNYILVNDEDIQDDDEEEVDDDQSSVASSASSKKSKMRNKKRSQTDDIVQEAELNTLKLIGENLKKRKEANQKDEDQLFGDLLVVQLKQLTPTNRILVKMEISNLIYKYLLPQNSQSQVQNYPHNAMGAMENSIASGFSVSNVMAEFQYGEPKYPQGYFFKNHSKQL